MAGYKRSPQKEAPTSGKMVHGKMGIVGERRIVGFVIE